MTQSDREPRLSGFARAAVTLGFVTVGAIVLAVAARPVAAPMGGDPAGLPPGATQGALAARALSTGDPGASGHTATLAPDVAIEETVPAPPVAQSETAAPTASAPLPSSVPEATTQMPATEPAATGRAAAPTSSPRATTVALTATPTVAEPTAQATEIPATPTDVPSATPTIDAGAALPATFDDLADLETFLSLSRNSIADQQFEIESLSVDTTDSALPQFALAIVAAEAVDIFALQPAAELISYGHRLLDDIRRYVGEQDCALTVESTYLTADTEACSGSPSWCQVGDLDQSTNLWTVTWTYVRASYRQGSETVQTWNSTP